MLVRAGVVVGVGIGERRGADEGGGRVEGGVRWDSIPMVWWLRAEGGSLAKGSALERVVSALGTEMG